MSIITSKHDINIVKTTPVKIGSISKTLLTPCRRVGLCRKVTKTPKTINAPLHNLSTTIGLVEQSSSAVLETPILDKCETSVISKNVKHSRVSREKKGLASGDKYKKFKPIVSGEAEGDNTCLKEGSAVIKPIKSTVTNLMIQDDNDVLGPKPGHLHVKAHENDLSKPKDSSAKDFKCEVSSSTENRQKISSNDKIKSNTSKKNFTRCLSMNRASSSDELSDLEDTVLADTSAGIRIDNLPKLELDDEDLNITANKFQKRKIIFSSDEDDFTLSQNSSKCISNVDLERMVVEIKQRIEVKSAQLEKLKQAAIYKKLHNVDHLNDLTTTWKNACHEALRYLLNKLQGHGPMDMPTLLQNLNIPIEHINYDINNDSFV